MLFKKWYLHFFYCGKIIILFIFSQYKSYILVIWSVQFSGINYLHNVVYSSPLFPKCFHHPKQARYPWSVLHLPPIPSTQAPGPASFPSALPCMRLPVLDAVYWNTSHKRNHKEFVLEHLAYLTWHNVSRVPAIVVWIRSSFFCTAE